MRQNKGNIDNIERAATLWVGKASKQLDGDLGSNLRVIDTYLKSGINKMGQNPPDAVYNLKQAKDDLNNIESSFDMSDYDEQKYHNSIYLGNAPVYNKVKAENTIQAIDELISITEQNNRFH